MHLGILTGGGDVPGLNPAIKAVVSEAFARGWRVTGFRRGWAGPVNTDPKNLEATAGARMVLTPENVRGIDRTGGTILHTSRTNPSRMTAADLPDFLSHRAPASGSGKIDITDHVLTVLDALEIDVLIAIGGDDTLSYASRIHREGAKAMCIPKTMDNDVFGTDYCIGFSTCVTRSVELINRLRTPVGSHERLLVVEMFGRNCGLTALMAGYLADADRTLIAEVPFHLDRLAEMLSKDRAASVSNYAMTVVSEGASVIGEEIIETGSADAYGHRKLGGIGDRVGQGLKERTGINVMVQNLGYLLRAGAPDAVDLMVPKNYGIMTVQLIEAGSTGLMVAVEDGCYTTKPADISMQGKRRVNVENMYDIGEYRPRSANLIGTPMYLR
ncbi:MAG: 6-phosphofructokinase [Rhodobiaceae bacterium]|nr:6-phosphofructokinase [Rhodobiaceae bacterium]MCC0011922.1 6-phosphofructokinase [Rhodobiaceae bacterium]MCC0018572.1 6-phosphofructokinase [Rhodobiaceae bacterium]MCC0050423.1 6-phosphofructokinase [Rhodobiaceae bacterium]MCC0061162.1 6-phosphofructokinase [Rhodobiaceae bacterium]